MSRPPEPVFLERQSYRRRRLGDAAKFLPLLGLILLLLPVLWTGSGTTAGGIIYIFSVWAILIVFSGVIARRLSNFDPFAGADGMDGQASDREGEH